MIISSMQVLVWVLKLVGPNLIRMLVLPILTTGENSKFGSIFQKFEFFFLNRNSKNSKVSSLTDYLSFEASSVICKDRKNSTRKSDHRKNKFCIRIIHFSMFLESKRRCIIKLPDNLVQPYYK